MRSAKASSMESCRPKAPESRPRIVAVGLASHRSILLIIALETLDFSASSPSDHPLASRSMRIRLAMAMEGSSRGLFMG